MKQNTHHLYYLFYPRWLVSLRRSGWIIITLLMLSAAVLAQEQTPPPEEFIIGTPIMHNLITNPGVFESFIATGMNTIHQRADNDTKTRLENYNLVAYNADTLEYIYHYSTSYYSKWEAEKNVDSNRVGMKHQDRIGNVFGETATWKNKLCWSTEGLSAPACSLMSGPHYKQEKRYKRWLYGCTSGGGCLTYTPRFRMALDYPDTLSPNEDVCVIKVVFRYKDLSDSLHHDTTFIARTLKVADFDSNGNFDDFYLHPDQSLGVYEYWPNFILPKEIDQMVDSEPQVNYIDWEEYTGIQFWVDWLRDDTLCTLYIDYVEVYDNAGWNKYLENPDEVADTIKAYVSRFKNSGWSNIKYWGGVDEPYTIDSYMPIHIVDSLIQSVQAPPLVVNFQPTWWHTLNVNGEDEMEMFYKIAKPSRITLSVNPCYEEYPVIRYQDLEWIRFNLQRTSVLDEDFWFHTQTTGYRTNYPPESPNWCVWRKPDPPELKSMVSLALAHGAKGIIFLWFDSYSDYSSRCLGNVYKESIVDENGNRLPDSDYSLYNTIKDNLVPRLKGKLGKTLLRLDYTGDYLQYYYFIPTEDDPPTPPTFEYLTLGQGEPSNNMNWHCGFFGHPSFQDDKYFFLTNLITTLERNIQVRIQTPDADPVNYRFRNVEGLFDTTIQSPHYLIKELAYPPGEGYLYEFAPVIKYGGRLLYPESVDDGITLSDDMVIENGAILTINGTYNANANITVKNGSIVNGENGVIKFAEGKKLIIQGNGTITGTENNKLELKFRGSQNEFISGIMINAGGSLTIKNCTIEDATIGIESSLNANYLNAQNVEFINCETHSISIIGRSPGMLPTPPPQINGCTMLNSNYGISVTNLSSILIQDNIITNTACGIYLSNVTDAQITNNFIQSNRFEMAGIYFQSSGGFIRANAISGHSVALHIANASPQLGSNGMTLNKYHGIYIGSRSLPYMRAGKFIGRPPNFYATSGYNKIYDNGGYEDDGGPADNDGSEIYFVNSNAVMDKGCNSIYDNREPEPPLINTYLLMNCPDGGPPIEVNGQMNYWGYRVEPERFGNLRVDYIPSLEEPCPEQQNSDDEFVIKTSFGDVIDTVYSVDAEIPEMTETEEFYAEAEGYFLSGDLINALQVYESIINSNATEEEKYFAYERKYAIGRLNGESIEYFNELSNTFSTLASNTQDTLYSKILNQFSTLSKVGEQEYETAIGEFDNIVQQNPNTEEAVYAEIDALTTALLIEEADSTLHKGRLGKYLIK